MPSVIDGSDNFDSATSGIESNANHIKFPDGALICHGYLFSEDETEAEVEFDIPFVGNSPHITITVKALGEQMVPTWSDINNLTHMKVMASDNSIEADYIAIGRWK